MNNDTPVRRYGTPEYNQLLHNLRAAIKRLEAAELEESKCIDYITAAIVGEQSLARTDIQRAALLLTEYYQRLSARDLDDIPF